MNSDRERLDDFVALLTVDCSDHPAAMGLIARVKARRRIVPSGSPRPSRKLLDGDSPHEARSRDG